MLLISIMFVLDNQLLQLNVITACRTHQQHLSFTPWAWRQRKMAALWIWNSLIFINFGFFVVELLKKQRQMNSEKKQNKNSVEFLEGQTENCIFFCGWFHPELLRVLIRLFLLKILTEAESVNERKKGRDKERRPGESKVVNLNLPDKKGETVSGRAAEQMRA